MTSTQSDLDRRTLQLMRQKDSGLASVPDEALRKTFAYALQRFGLALGDLGKALWRPWRQAFDKLFDRWSKP